jgi:hypothetical protein
VPNPDALPDRSAADGLTEQQVAERVARGETNVVPDAPTRTIGQIVRGNVFTPVNFIVGVLAALVLLAGSPKDALFGGIIVANSIIGVVQELRAKKVLDSLSVVNAPRAHVVRGGDSGQGQGCVAGNGILALAPSSVRVRGAVAITAGAAVGAGQNGVPVFGAAQVVTGLPALPTLSLAGTAPTGGALAAAQPVTIALDAPTLPGQLYVLLAGIAPGYTSLNGLTAEPLLLGAGAGIVNAGLLDPAGRYSLTFTPSTATQEWVGVPLHMQAFVFAPATATWHGTNMAVHRFAP